MCFLPDEGGLQVGRSREVIYGVRITQTQNTGGLLMVVVCRQIHRVSNLSSLINSLIMVVVCRQIHRVSNLSSLINSLVIHARVLIESIGIR